MAGSDYAAFQLTLKAFNGICMIVTFDIFASMVVYYFMHIIFR